MKKLFVFSLLLALLLGPFAYAGGDHSHDTPAIASGLSLPRFTAQSDLFEAVGVLSGDELSILIDRYTSNEPVLNAKVEIESGSLKALVAFHADHGDYSTPSAPFKKPGTYPITLTITAGDSTDLLAGELLVPEPQGAVADTAHAASWFKWLGGLAALTALALIAVLARRKFAQRRNPNFGNAI